jgi:hypothetical protein
MHTYHGEQGCARPESKACVLYLARWSVGQAITWAPKAALQVLSGSEPSATGRDRA